MIMVIDSVEYFSELDPEAFPHVPSELKSVFAGTEFPDWVIESVALHFFVERGSSYSLSGPDVPSPREMMNRLEGDCQDQSVLLGSLYQSVDLDVRFVVVRDSVGGNQHVFPEVYCPVPDSELVCSVLRKFYSKELGRNIDEIFFEEEADEIGFWLVADPEFSYYLGDLRNLKRDGYARDLAGGSWEWTNLVEVQKNSSSQ
jgi:hypothetical protein